MFMVYKEVSTLLNKNVEVVTYVEKHLNRFHKEKREIFYSRVLSCRKMRMSFITKSRYF